MAARSSSPDAVRDLYERLTDLMVQAMGGYLHGGYVGGPDPADTMEEAADTLTDLVAERCGLVAGQRVLDVGSGNGKATVRVAAAYHVRAEGITLSEYQARLSRELAEAEGMADAVSFRVADLHDIPFPDAKFDAALAIESFCHVVDRARAYREIGRVVRDGGRIVATDLVLRRPIVDDERKMIVEASNANFENGPILSEDDYVAAIRAAGLDLVEFADIGDEVWPSFATVADNMRHARSLVEGYMNDREFHHMVDSLDRFATVPEIGYVLMVARKSR